ncbi:MAG: alpha/beta fold hydrolase [Chitinophagaceae bacterium]|nr:alpha/beta fold hydrolase [Chitinophagaceae bacterium]
MGTYLCLSDLGLDIKVIVPPMKLAQRLALGYVRGKLRLLSKVSKRKAAEKAFDLFCTPQFRNLKKRPPIFKEAEMIQEKFLDYKLVGYRWNKGGQRRVLIIHGFESSVVNFDHYIKPLIRKGYEVLAFDAPAHGRSSGKQINALIFRDFILHVNKQFGPIHSFMAHSFGGMALGLALEMIPHDEEYRVVLIAPLTETTTSMGTFFHLLRIDPATQAEFSALITRMAGKDPSWYSLRRVMPNLKARVLWFHDEDDGLTPLRDAEKVKADGHPHVEFVISKGLGHRRIYRDNQVKKRIVSFL